DNEARRSCGEESLRVRGRDAGAEVEGLHRLDGGAERDPLDTRAGTTRVVPATPGSSEQIYLGGRDGPPNPPTFGAPRETRGAPRSSRATFERTRRRRILPRHGCPDRAARRCRRRRTRWRPCRRTPSARTGPRG